MMKYVICVLVVFFNILSHAQVGVNTTNPQRDLDINGNLRVKVSEYKDSDPNYSKVLVTDSDGNVDYWDKQNIIDQMENVPVETKRLYFSNAPDASKIVTCGKFDIRFSLSNGATQVNTQGNNILSQIRLSSKASSNTQNIYYFYTEKVNSNASNFNGQVGTATNSNFSKTDFTNIGNYNLNKLTEVFLSYPGDINYYRVVFLVRNMTYTTNNSNWTNSYGFSMICEKF